MKFEQQVRREKRFEHEPVIRGGFFEVDTVFAGLVEDLRVDDVLPGLKPLSSLRRRPEERSEKHQANAVAQIVIPVDLAPLEVSGNVLAMHIQRAQKSAAKCPRAARRGVAEEIETPDPADGPQRDIHRARPVYAVAPGIPRNPVRGLVDELLRVSFIACEPVRLTERREVLAPAELPGNLDIGGFVDLQIFDVR